MELHGKFIAMQDNEDGTVTMSMGLPDILGDQIQTCIVQGSMDELMAGMIPMIAPEAFDNFAEKSVMIPNHVVED